MSGIKDYTMSVEEARRQALRRMCESILSERAVATKARLAASATLAQEQIGRSQAARREATRRAAEHRQRITEADLKTARRTGEGQKHVAHNQPQRIGPERHQASPGSENVRQMTEIIAEVHQGLSSLSEISGEVQGKEGFTQELMALASLSNPDRQAIASGCDLVARVQDALDTAKQQEAELQECLEHLSSWQKELAEEASVGFYQRHEAGEWQQQAEMLLKQWEGGMGLADALADAKALSVRAEEVYTEAGIRQGKAETRNALLRDIVASLKEIGFFVADPYYKDPSDPTGPVIVKANRGREEMTAAIDLTSQVHSVWDGIAGEHCRGAFFEYVDRMREKGVTIAPMRDDLQERPKLLEKGAKELPRGHQSQAGE